MNDSFFVIYGSICLRRIASPPRAGAAAGMRVTEVRKAGWHIRRRPKINSYDARKSSFA